MWGIVHHKLPESHIFSTNILNVRVMPTKWVEFAHWKGARN